MKDEPTLEFALKSTFLASNFFTIVKSNLFEKTIPVTLADESITIVDNSLNIKFYSH